MSNIVRVDGWPCAPGTAAAFTGRLKPAFERAFPGVTLHVYSGYRSYDDQVKIFTERYRRNGHSPYGDYRYWDGSMWGRVSGAGTVAAPGTSNHQSGHALDIRDSGSDAGVTIAGNARSNWIRANAASYGFTPIGYTFAEPWHIEYTGEPWTENTGSGGGGITETPDITTESEEDADMRLFRINDSKSGRNGRHYAIAPEYIKQIKTAEAVKAFEDAFGVTERPISEWTLTRVLGVYGIPSGVLNGRGYVLDDLTGQGKYVSGGTWSRAQKVERLAYVAQKR